MTTSSEASDESSTTEEKEEEHHEPAPTPSEETAHTEESTDYRAIIESLRADIAGIRGDIEALRSQITEHGTNFKHEPIEHESVVDGSPDETHPWFRDLRRR